jgi:hypothetical protein
VFFGGMDAVAGPMLKQMKALLETLVTLDSVTKTNPLLEDDFA